MSLIRCRLVTACLMGLISLRAEAQVLTFDELTSPDHAILGTVVCAASTGFSFASDHFHLIDAATLTDFAANGTAYIGYESGRGFPITMQRVGSGTFSLFSLDAGEFYNPDQAERPNAQTLTVTGFQQGGGVVTHTLALDGVHDGPGGLPDFEHFTLPNTFVNLTSVRFTGLRAGNLDGGVSVDNLEYLASGGPEVLPACVLTPLPTSNPSLSIVQPSAGFVAGTISVEAVVSSFTVASLQVFVDGVPLGGVQTTAPFAVPWDTTSVVDGPHTVLVEARDASNVLLTSSVTVTVRNHPVASGPAAFLEFDGVDDYAQVADAAALSFGTGTADTPFTIEMWFRPDAMGRHQLLGKWGESTNQEYKVTIVSGTIRVDLRDQSAQAGANAFTSSNLSSLIGAWHHLAVTYDGRGGPTAAQGLNIYIDGVAASLVRSTGAAYVAMENLAAPLQIGRNGPSWQQYDGGLDDVRLWAVARTPAELQASMAVELIGNEPGLAAYWRFNEGSGPTAADAVAGGGVVTLLNGTSWQLGGPLASTEPDVTAPDITDLGISGLTHQQVTVTFTTSEPSSARVVYTAGTSCPCVEVVSGVVGTAHAVTLTGLNPDTTYQYVVQAADAAGNTQVSPTQIVHTLLPPPDAVPPVVTLVRPTGGTVLGLVTIEATATDNVGVVAVDVRVDGVVVGTTLMAPPYLVTWDSTGVADGQHTITVQARDALNNVGTATAIVTVRNTPVVTTPFFLEFDGVDDYAQVADAAALSFGTGTADTPFTIEMWFRPDAMGRHQLLGKWGESTNQEYKVTIVSGTIRVDLRDQSAQAGANAFTSSNLSSLIGAWHHLAVTYDGRGGPTAAQGLNIYIDGVAASLVRSTGAAYVAMENLAAPLQIGRNGPSWQQYDGGLDDVRLWAVARTPAELQASMAVELIGNEPGLAAYWRFNEGSGPTAADAVAGGGVVTLLNGTSWQLGGPLASTEPDVTAPDITDLGISGLTHQQVTVTFTTSEPSSARVVYTAGTSCPCVEVVSGVVGTAHAVTLTGLNPDTTYQYVVQAADAAGNTQVSPTQIVHTLLPPPDAVPPVVTLVRPTGGTVLGLVTIEATATDNVGVVAVDVRVDGVVVGTTLMAPPYLVTWDSTGVADGQHTITVQARDALNNVGTATAIVTVRNTPVVTTPFFLEFDGVDDYAQVADAAALSFGTGTADTPFTIEMWFRPDAMGRHQLLGKWGESTNQEYKVTIVSGTIRVDLRDQSAQAGANAFTSSNLSSLIGAWHHLAVTYDGRGGPTAAQGLNIYIDGVAASLVRSTGAAYVAMENLAAPLQIGRNGPSWQQYDGGLDDVRLWAVARTPAELQASMAVELIGNEPGLAAYWRFNEGSGSTAAAETGGTPATLQNGVLWQPGGLVTP